MTQEYLDRIGFATIRREPGDNSDEAIDNLLKDYIEACQADLVRIGVPKEIATDETNASVFGCQCSYVRWRMSFNNSDSVPNRDEYLIQADSLRRSIYE